MAASYNLSPNESVILKEASVAHGGIMAAYTDELILTNQNIICINKGVFGNTKNIFKYPLSQIKRYNGKPQAIMGKLSNGTLDLEVYFQNGVEQFYFQSSNKIIITKWINEIAKALGCNVDSNEQEDDNSYDPNTLIGAFMEVGSQFKEVGNQFKEALGIQYLSKHKVGTKQASKINKKCISCSAPLIGYEGQVVHCKYCDTKQTL